MSTVSVLIAVVDNEESVRRALGRLIRSAGFSIETFSSGADFLGSIHQRRPDCVVLDIRMPHLDGFEIQQALTKANDPMPVIVVTGDDSAEARTRAFQCGAKAYLRKPVDEAILLAAIRNALSPSPGLVT